jgi:predicted nucleic-acid-binding protein
MYFRPSVNRVERDANIDSSLLFSRISQDNKVVSCARQRFRVLTVTAVVIVSFWVVKQKKTSWSEHR